MDSRSSNKAYALGWVLFLSALLLSAVCSTRVAVWYEAAAWLQYHSIERAYPEPEKPATPTCETVEQISHASYSSDWGYGEGYVSGDHGYNSYNKSNSDWIDDAINYVKDNPDEVGAIIGGAAAWLINTFGDDKGYIIETGRGDQLQIYDKKSQLLFEINP